MRETRTYGSEGGEGEGSSLPLSGVFAGLLIGVGKEGVKKGVRNDGLKQAVWWRNAAYAEAPVLVARPVPSSRLNSFMIRST